MRWASSTNANSASSTEHQIPVKLTTWIGISEKPVMRLRLRWARRNRLYFELPLCALVVADRNLGDALGERVGQRRDERRLLVAGDHRVDDVPAIGAQHASIVVHRHADDHRGQPVVQPRGEACDRPGRGAPRAIRRPRRCLRRSPRSAAEFPRADSAGRRRASPRCRRAHWRKPARMAECWPKLRASSTTRTRAVFAPPRFRAGCRANRRPSRRRRRPSPTGGPGRRSTGFSRDHSEPQIRRFVVHRHHDRHQSSLRARHGRSASNR